MDFSQIFKKLTAKHCAFIGIFFWATAFVITKVVLKEEEIIKFLQNGAQPTRTVKSILVKAGVWAKFEESKKK